MINYDNYDFIRNPTTGETYYCIGFNVPEETPQPTGTIRITKYTCPADTELTRTANGVTGTVPESCSPQQGAMFGYTYDTTKMFPDTTGPYPGLSPDMTSFTPLAFTDANGVSETTGMALSGRYVIVEFDGSGKQLPADQMLALYCQFDGDPNPNHNDNQEVTYISGGITNCIAYNKTTPPVYQCSDGIDNDDDGLIDYPADPGCSSLTDNNETDTPPIVYQCSDGLDNDDDGLIDYPADPGCSNPTDDSELLIPLYFIDAIKNVSGLMITLDSGSTRADPFTGDFAHQYVSINR